MPLVVVGTDQGCDLRAPTVGADHDGAAVHLTGVVDRSHDAVLLPHEVADAHARADVDAGPPAASRERRRA